jgi:hypothetical protein
MATAGEMSGSEGVNVTKGRRGLAVVAGDLT